MAQNPADRDATAAEFRDALSRLGRAEVNEGLEFVAHKAPIEASVVEVNNEIVAAAVQVRMISRAGARARRRLRNSADGVRRLLPLLSVEIAGSGD